eukprot:9578529-Ditylum_brightwellii.AAC.1
MDAIDQLRLEIDAFTVRTSILRGARGQTRAPVLRGLKEANVLVKKGSKSKLRVMIPEKSEKSGAALYFTMQALKVALPLVIVQGIPTVNRAVINAEDEGKNGKETYHLLVEGY